MSLAEPDKLIWRPGGYRKWESFQMAWLSHGVMVRLCACCIEKGTRDSMPAFGRDTVSWEITNGENSKKIMKLAVMAEKAEAAPYGTTSLLLQHMVDELVVIYARAGPCKPMIFEYA